MQSRTSAKSKKLQAVPAVKFCPSRPRVFLFFPPLFPPSLEKKPNSKHTHTHKRYKTAKANGTKRIMQQIKNVVEKPRRLLRFFSLRHFEFCPLFRRPSPSWLLQLVPPVAFISFSSVTRRKRGWTRPGEKDCERGEQVTVARGLRVKVAGETW